MRKILCLVSAALLLAAGCKRGPSFSGSWDVVDPRGSGVFVLSDDKTFTMTGSFGAVSAKGKGTWTATDKDLTETPTELKADGIPEMYKSQVDSAINALLNQPQTGAVTWKSDDQFIWKRKDADVTYTRVKGG